MDKKETALSAAIAEVIDGLALHIGKIGEYDNETLRAALNEDLDQLKAAIGETKEKAVQNRTALESIPQVDDCLPRYK